MYARLILIAATLTSTSAFAADPVKPAAQPTVVQPKKATAPVVLASAGDVPADATATQPASTPPKRRGRVTTCRCGDQQAQPEPDQQ